MRVISAITSLHQAYRLLDPGGVRLVRGVHLTLSTLVAGLAGYYMRLLVPNVGIPNLAIYSAAAAGLCQIFIAPGPRLHEVRLILLNGLIFTAVLSLAIPMLRAGWSADGLAPGAIWAVLIGLGFYLRRFGRIGERAGSVLSIAWLFVVVAKPDLPDALWLPFGSLLGVMLGIAVKTLLWRPSPLFVLKTVRQSFARQISLTLSQTASGRCHQGRDFAFLVHMLKVQKRELILAAEAAQRADEISAAQSAAIVANATKQQLALDVFVDVFGETSTDDQMALVKSPVYQEVVGIVADNVMSSGDGSVSEAEFDPGWFDRLENDTRMNLFRLMRMHMALVRLDKLACEQVWRPEKPGKTVATTRPSKDMLPSWRLAAQGLVAAAATVAIGDYLQLNHAYWGTMTVVFVLCNTLGTTVKRAFERALGTAVGVVGALVLYEILKNFPALQLAAIFLIFPFLFVALERNYLTAAAILGFCVVLGLHMLAGGNLELMAARIYETAIGALVGLIASLLVFPIRAGAGMRGLIDDLLADCRNLVRCSEKDDPEIPRKIKALHGKTVKLNELHNGFVNEQLVLTGALSHGPSMVSLIDVIVDYVSLFVEARQNLVKGSRTDQENDLLTELDEALEDSFATVTGNGSFPDMEKQTTRWRKTYRVCPKQGVSHVSQMVDVFYFGKKVVSCLNDLSENPVYRSTLSVKKTPRA